MVRTLNRPSSFITVSAVPAPKLVVGPIMPPGRNGTEAVCGVGESGEGFEVTWSAGNS